MPLGSDEFDRIRRAKAGRDPKHMAAYAEAFDDHRMVIYSFLCRMLDGDLEEAKNQLQETFIAGWKNLSTLNDDTSFRAWLFKIAENKARSHLRHERLIPMVPIDHSDAGDFFQATADTSLEENVVTKVMIEQALAQIPLKCRICLLLQQEGFSRKEIAEHLQYSESSIPKTLSRCRQELRDACIRLGLREDIKLDLERRPEQ